MFHEIKVQDQHHQSRVPIMTTQGVKAQKQTFILANEHHYQYDEFDKFQLLNRLPKSLALHVLHTHG